MRASKSILAILVLLCSTVPALAIFPGWQKSGAKAANQPPEKKAQILDRMETFEHMTPQQQAAARNLFQQYHNLPEDQRAKVSQAYRRLRGMPPDARNQALNSDEYRNNFTDEQRELLRGMTDLNLPPNH